MKAILLRRTGGPSVLEYVEVPTPVPGEILVKAHTIGVSIELYRSAADPARRGANGQ